jgi:hypothetical protein
LILSIWDAVLFLRTPLEFGFRLARIVAKYAASFGLPVGLSRQDSFSIK